MSAAVACPQQVAPVMPRQALRLGLEGEVQAELLIEHGQVVAVDIRSGPALFHEAVRQATSQYRCTVSTESVKVSQTFVFKLN
jgi:protein TonB